MYFILSVWLHHVCLAHTHKLGDAHATHSPPTHTHTHSCMQWNVLFYVVASSWRVCESASVSCPLANIACPSRPTFVYARMRYAGHTSNVCGILGQLKSFKTLDTNRLAPLYVCVCVFVCACGCSSRWSHIIGRHPYANCIPYISGIPFLNRATRKNER